MQTQESDSQGRPLRRADAAVGRRTGVVAVCCRDGRFLVVRRAQGVPFAGRWCFPGGAVERGEDDIAALKRELQEELGLDVRPLYKLFSSDAADGKHILHWYLAEAAGARIRPNPTEVDAFRWASLAELGRLPGLLETNRRFLEACRPQLEKIAEGFSADARVMSEWQSQISDHLDELRSQGLYRKLRIVSSPAGRLIRLDAGQGARQAVNFASNDYLGLAADPRVAEAAGDALGRWGWGAGASQLVCGHTGLHRELASALARFKRSEAAIVLPTGYMANLAVITALAGPEDVVLLDKLNHASIIDAARLSGAQVRVFPHKNYAKLERLLQRYRSVRRRIIVTDSLFSMDGDLADLPELVRLKQTYEAVLVVDEAHATCVLGPEGRGVAAVQGVEDQIDASVGTLSKALGGIGGFVAASGTLIEHLVNTARSFIFTTALPPAACAAALRALEIAQSESWRRRRALSLAERLRTRLAESGWDCGDSQSQIVPVLVGRPDAATALSEALLAKGHLAPAIRPPAVPPASARLRVSITASHLDEDIDGLATALAASPGV